MEPITWTNELQEIVNLKTLFLIENQKIVKEIDSLVTAQNDEVAFLYTRRTLEVIITEICLDKLCRDRGNEPLLSIIDRLHKDKIVPDFVHTAMQNLNKHATYGVHPKEFDSNQVRTAILELVTILKWYFKEKNYNKVGQKIIKPEKQQVDETSMPGDKLPLSEITKKRMGFVSIVIIVIITAISVVLVVRIINSSTKRAIIEADTSKYSSVKKITPIMKPVIPDTQNKNRAIKITAAPVSEGSFKQPVASIKPVKNIKAPEMKDRKEMPALQENREIKQEGIDELFQRITDTKLTFAERKKISVRILNEFDKKAIVSIINNRVVVERMGIEDYLKRLMILKGLSIKINKKETNAIGKISELDVTEEKR